MPTMKVSVEQLSATERKVHVELPQERVRRELDKAYRELSRTVKIKGFRPGKVPLDILKRRFGAQVENEVGLQLVNDSFLDAMKQGDIEAVSDLTCVKGVDCIIVTVAHNVFKTLGFKQLRQISNHRPVLLDVRGIFDPSEALRRGFDYQTL